MLVLLIELRSVTLERGFGPSIACSVSSAVPAIRFASSFCWRSAICSPYPIRLRNALTRIALEFLRCAELPLHATATIIRAWIAHAEHARVRGAADQA
jgi:hypothetical protein